MLHVLATGCIGDSGEDKAYPIGVFNSQRRS